MLQGLCCLLLAACVILPSVRPLMGAAQVLSVQLKEEASVQSGMISLKDVAELRGTEANRLQKLARIELAPAPEFGSTALISRQQIQELVGASAGPLTGVFFTGAAAVRVRLQGRPADPSEITAILKARLLETTDWKESELEVISIRGLQGVELPPGEIELRISSRATVAGRNSILAPIEVCQGGKTFTSFWITAEIEIKASVLTASKKIPFEKIITPDDFVETMIRITDLRAVHARRPEDILGKASRRRFSPGDPLTRDSFTEPLLVRHGETVQLRLERNGIVLTSLVKAEQDGRLGQVITVRNVDFSTALKAQVSGRGAVRIQ